MPFQPTSGALDVILGLAMVATLFTWVRHWTAYWDDDFTVSDRRLAMQIGVFVVPPVVVLFHELGHYVAAHALGVATGRFHYGLFEGSVEIIGRRTLDQNWLIFLAGNVVSVVAGLIMLGAGLALARRRRPLRYLLLFGGLMEAVFALVGYPFLSLTSRFGDWPVIYSRRTPGLRTATAVVHVGLLAGLWLWWRRSGKSTLFAVGSSAEQKVDELRAAVAAAPSDSGAWLALADFYARQGELGLARTAVEEGISACGDVPRLLLGLTRLSMFAGRWNDAVIAARRGLEGPAEEDVRQPLWANLALALTQMERPDHALPAYANVVGPLADDPRVRYGRGLVRLESGDAGGRADLAAVVDALPEGNLLRAWAAARLEGHVLEKWDDPRMLPAYMKGNAPPPAPLAGL